MQEAEYEVLNILEFSSTRKRMSVVVRTPDDRVVLYCKGADSVIYERLARGHATNEALREPTLRHMEEYGGAGLRTLCLAYRELEPAAYDAWQGRYVAAKTALDGRAAKVEAVAEDLEADLVLLGATAIEDKLQDGVPAAIRALAGAGIRLWVLTGDKAETAVNIGYAAGLVTDEMTQFHVAGQSAEAEALEAGGFAEEATLLAGAHVRSQLERVRGRMIVLGGLLAFARGLGTKVQMRWLVVCAPPRRQSSRVLLTALLRLQVARNIAEAAYGGGAPGAAPPGRCALVIDGRALLHALSPVLRELFLEVRCLGGGVERGQGQS